MAQDTSCKEFDRLRDHLSKVSQNETQIQCVFSSSEVQKVGTGTTTRKHVTRIYWMVEEESEDRFAIRTINANHLPTGDEKIISLQELLERFQPEIDYFENNTLPALEELEEYLDDGEMDRLDGRLYSAESTLGKALAMDESNARALFNLGLIYLSMSDMDRTRTTLQGLLGSKSTFDGKNQHLFNEFGIALRKANLLAEAADYYRRALDYTRNDENLFYNLARVEYERSNWEGCLDATERVLKLNPKHEVGRNLAKIIVTMTRQPDLCRKHGKSPVPSSIARKIETSLGPLVGSGVKGSTTSLTEVSLGNIEKKKGTDRVQAASFRLD